MAADVNQAKLSRRERERLARRREILVAARKVFGARGYEGATLDEVAREAEFAKGTLYSYFDSKAALFTALMEYEFAELTDRAEKALKREKDTVQAVRATILVFLTYFEERMDFFRAALACHEKGLHDEVEVVRDKVLRHLATIGNLLGEKLAEGARGGVIKEYDSRLLGFLLLGMVHYYAAYIMKSGSGRGHADAADMLSDIYLDGVRTLAAYHPEER
jgi:AcrR family transcriptional regulator